MESAQSRTLFSAGYVVAFLMATFALLDLFGRLFPLRAADTSWRIGAVGIVSLNMTTLLLALLVTCLTAYHLQHRRTLRTLSVLSLLAAFIAFLVLPLFALDVLELRRLVRADGKGTFDVAMGRAALTILLTACALAWIGVGSWKATVVRSARKSTAVPAAGVLLRA